MSEREPGVLPNTPAVWRRAERRAVRGLHHLVARWYLRKPELADLLDLKLPDVSSTWVAARNEWRFRRRSSTAHRLVSLNLEATNFCNLSCSFCPVNHGMTRTKRYLDPGLFRKAIDESPDLRFILPFQWGEPLLHPEIDTMIRYAADRGVRSMMTTNGTLLDDRNIDRLLRSGLTRLTISIDGDAETHEEVRDVALDDVRDRVVALRQERDRRRSPMRIDVSMVLADETKDGLESFRRDWVDLADRIQVIPVLAEAPRTSPCRELWRGSLVMLVDGTVTACCVDSEGTLDLGNFKTQAPPDVLNAPPMRALRDQHRRGEFPSPCKQCSEYPGDEFGVHARFGP